LDLACGTQRYGAAPSEHRDSIRIIAIPILTGHFSSEIVVEPEIVRFIMLLKAFVFRRRLEVFVRERVMSTKIFVGGLRWGMDNNSLKREFERFGAIEEATVVRDRETNRSKGFGFVTFVDETSAQQAINEMNGKEIEGRVVKVDFAQDKPRSFENSRR
jgi:hypothetical protein